VTFELAKTVFRDRLQSSALTIVKTMARETFASSGCEGAFIICDFISNARTAFESFQLGGQHSMSKTTISGKTPRAMTTEAVERAARLDPDARPLTEADLKRMKRTPAGEDHSPRAWT